MFTGFNLKINDNYDFDSYYEVGKAIFDSNKFKIKKELDSFIDGEGFLDGSKIQNSWFPQIKADIFISHSHEDEKKVIALAGWLNKMLKLDVFIDSCVWGYSDELLKIIDNKYCVQKEDELNKTYDYKKRNYSTSHVHMMLQMALSMMIDKTECLFFLNTPNSINTSASDIIDNTKSPWIYSEIVMTKLVRIKSLNEYRPGIILEKNVKNKFAQDAQLQQFKYTVDLTHLHELNQNDLILWENRYSRDNVPYALDKLYEL